MLKDIVIDFDNPNNYFSIKIYRERENVPFYTTLDYYNAEGDVMYIVDNFGFIDEIECVYCCSATEMPVIYPPLDEIRKAPILIYRPILINEDENSHFFAIVYSKEKLNILFSSNIKDIVFYCQEVRINYYTDRHHNLISIEINDLQPCEYSALRRKRASSKIHRY